MRMLKFADLSIDFKSFENTLSSYLKLFPNSYMPLLIMYLSREGLLEIINGADANDSRVLLSVKKHDLLELLKSNLSKAGDFKTMEDLYFKAFGIEFNKKDWVNNYDWGVVFAIAEVLKLILKDEDSFSLVYHSNGNEDIDRVVKILLSNSRQAGETAVLWFFWMIFMKKVPVKQYGDDEYVNQEGIESFEMTLQRTSAYYGRVDFMQPLELTRIILSQYKGGSVYNPFAGVASYHIAMSYGLRKQSEFIHYDKPILGRNSLGDSYYGEEINELTWAIGKLRLMFYHMNSANYILSDSTKEFEGKINNILTTPPFNLQIINEKGDKEFADHFVIRRGVEMLADNGMMAIVVPVSFLSRRDTFDIRKDLVSKHLLTHVVYLPENIFSFTRISTAILLVHKNTKKESLKFVDATSRRANIYGLNVAAISNLIEHDVYPKREGDFTFGEYNLCDELTPSVFNTCISFEDYGNIAANDYDLSPSYYFSSYIDIPEGFKLVQFHELVSAKSPANISNEVEGKVLSNSNLAKDYQMPYVDIDSLDSKVVNRNFKLLEKKSLLVSSMNELKPSIYVPSGVNVYVSPNVLAFYLNDKKINADYLVGELSKDYVREQLRLRIMGSTIQRIKWDDILWLKILVPDSKDFLKKEKDIANTRRDDYLEKMGVELSDLKDRRHDEYVKMLRQRKHRIQQVMNEFAPAFSLLDKCREKNEGILRDDDIVSTRTGETVSSYFQKLHVILNKVEDLVTNLVDKENWGSSSMVNIDSYVDNIPQHHLSDKYDIQALHDHDVYIEEEGETADLNNDRFISVNPDDLTIIFDNIIANASKWGFTDSIRRDYRIRIYVSDTTIDGKSAVRICISNNGSPIHPTVDRKRFFDWGYGSGTGIGTWQLKDIVEHYGGSIRLNENPEETSGFVTEYEIVLPLIDD